MWAQTGPGSNHFNSNDNHGQSHIYKSKGSPRDGSKLIIGYIVDPNSTGVFLGLKVRIQDFEIDCISLSY